MCLLRQSSARRRVTKRQEMVPSEEFIARRLQGNGSRGISSDGYSEISLSQNTQLKCAAVLIPLAPIKGEWHLLYTRRADTVEHHKGQVSFPGGACDPGEGAPEQTALREAQEEIGLRPSDVRLLGRLDSMITVTHFRVVPVVGVIPWPYVFQVSNVEVGRVFMIPLNWLAENSNRWEFSFPGRPQSVIAYHPYDGELLWGATARMTVDFLKYLE